MRVALLSHPSALDHDTGRGHPERPDRIGAVQAGVRTSGLTVVEHEPEPVSRTALELAHDAAYIDEIAQFCREGGGHLDPDTVASPGSWEAALRAAGAGLTAIDLLRRDGADTAFVAMRPPGHHAMHARAMGFCLFNNIAVAVRSLRAEGERVAVIDWDVHHGNGTQDAFYEDGDVLYVSWHEFPAYPGTGGERETGAGSGEGTTVNFPWPWGTDGAPYRWTMERVVLPVIRRFGADWVFVSAGYDAHVADPLAGVRLTAADYEILASSLAGVAPPGRLVFFLEGGYDLGALRESVAATLRGVATSHAEAALEPASGATWQIALRVGAAAGDHWGFDPAR
ncbi:MAG: histone deacetylase family protein [Acidimicrobiia bacterium]